MLAGSCNSPDVEIGQWRFRLSTRIRPTTSGNGDEYIQCFLYNRSHFDVSAKVSFDLVDGSHKCVKHLSTGSSFWNLLPGHGRGLKEWMLRSTLTNPANGYVASGRLYIRANVVIAHPDTPPLCSYTMGQMKYNIALNSALSDLAAACQTEAVASDFCIVVTDRASDGSVDSPAHNEVRIPAHKLILAARSPVFRAMLSSGMQEASADEMEITGYAVEAVRAFVRFLYCDACSGTVLEKHAWDLLAMADKYDVSALRTVCESYLSGDLSSANALQTLVSAEGQGANMLKRKAISYVVTSGRKLLKTPGVHEVLGSELTAQVMTALVDTVDAADAAEK
jgi:hypothetical protein